eukprot:8642604-Pyramimonas_sp.AAC.1
MRLQWATFDRSTTLLIRTCTHAHTCTGAGEWAELRLEMVRLSPSAMSLEVELNGTFYQTTHTWSSKKEVRTCVLRCMHHAIT